MKGQRPGSLAVMMLALCACAAPVPVSMLAAGDAPRLPAPAQTRGAGGPPAPQGGYYASELKEAYEAFHSGDYERAMLGYERVAGRADEPRIQIRALISLAMIRLLPSSKMHDVDAARVVLGELDKRIGDSGLRYEFFGELELLELLVKQDEQLAGERAASGRLRKELAARDALIRELRALSVETQ